MKLGLLLPNQGVVFGATTVSELLELAERAEGSGVFESLWVGDNLLAKPRLESVTVLSALAMRTKTSRLGTACMASFPLRNPVVLAAQWGALAPPSHVQRPQEWGNDSPPDPEPNPIYDIIVDDFPALAKALGVSL